MSFLEVNGIDVFYGQIQALRGLSIKVDEGEMVALLGSNGAGKTTTLRTISGLLTPSSGTISFRGEQMVGVRADKLVGKVSHLPEGRELFAGLSVMENLRLGGWVRRKRKKQVQERMDWALDLFPRLRERASQRAGTLSGGEQQMLGVARALMSEPQLLLVDELSLGLAPLIVKQLFDALHELNRQGTSVLLVEQFVHMALENTHRAYVLSKGTVKVEDASSNLLASPEVLAAYLGESEVPAEEPKPAKRKKAKSRKSG